MPSSPTQVSRSIGRPPDRQKAIVSQLRRRIVGGELQPGERLPNRSEIESTFAASSITVQRALDQLVSDGFVAVRGRLGSFVTDKPPHLNRYAVVFASHPGMQWSQFSQALLSEGQRVLHASEREFGFYYDLNGHEDSEDYQQLLRDLASQRIAGIVFTFLPYMYFNSPLFADPKLPRVAIGKDETPNLRLVNTDRYSFLDKALDYVAERGCRTVAFLNSPDALSQNHIEKALAARRLTSQPYWQLRIGLDLPAGARESTHLMFHAGQKQRPDALIISDDNLVQHATGGLIDAGVRVPHDVEVVAHCNFPHPTPSVVPVKRLGFDTREVLETMLEIVDAQRRGKKVPQLASIKARFEDELIATVR
jgi:DNA-binding LacI/PurR family transcriptional regulator